MSAWPEDGGRAVIVMHESLSHGVHGTSARLEVHESAPDRTARLALRGWLDAVALARLARRFDDLARQGVRRLVLDLGELQHVDYRLVPALTEALERFEARSGAVVVYGLSAYLRDIFRLCGCEARLNCWPPAVAAPGSPRELAS
jgi:anti-anti-sigma regulatory factor